MSTRSMREAYERDRKIQRQRVIVPYQTRAVKVYESPWPDKESDRAARCQSCGQLLGKRCRRDGCGKQAKP